MTRVKKTGKLLLQFRGTTMRTLGALPLAGAHEDFAVPVALAAMEFIDRHDAKLMRRMTGAKTKKPGQTARGWLKGPGNFRLVQ